MWSTIKHLATALLGWLTIAVFLFLVVVVLAGVFSRWLLGDQYRWSEELARFLLVWISFLGGAIAYIDDKHLGVDLLVNRLETHARRLSRVLTHGMICAFALLAMGVGGTVLVIDRFDSGQLMPALQIHKAWFYLAVPTSGFLIALFAAGNVIAMAAGAGDTTTGNSNEKEVNP